MKTHTGANLESTTVYFSIFVVSFHIKKCFSFYRHRDFLGAGHRLLSTCLLCHVFALSSLKCGGYEGDAKWNAHFAFVITKAHGRYALMWANAIDYTVQAQGSRQQTDVVYSKWEGGREEKKDRKKIKVYCVEDPSPAIYWQNATT